MPSAEQKKLASALKIILDVSHSLEYRFGQAHLTAAKDWPDWFEYLTWAVQSNATAAEMVLFRKADKGEDLLSGDGGPSPSGHIKGSGTGE